jgi:hypothetical protein
MVLVAAVGLARWARGPERASGGVATWRTG